MQALLSLDHFPAGMELFPASDDDQWAMIKGVIDDSDYYVLVIGGRYGSTNEAGISYTEMEFDYALSAKKPVLAFIHDRPEEIPSGKTDRKDKLRQSLERFRHKVESGRHVKYWSNPGELQARVIQSISAETKRNPQEGWIRANRATDPTIVEALRQEIDRLKIELDSLRSEAPVDAESYAGGSQKFSVRAEVTVKTPPFSYGTVYISVMMSWNALFAETGPMMMEEATERAIKNRISDRLPAYCNESLPENSVKIVITDSSFDTIKIQLFALGLIRKSTKRHFPSDTSVYWTLTPYGENMLMKLRAIRKEESGVRRIEPASSSTEPVSHASDGIKSETS